MLKYAGDSSENNGQHIERSLVDNGLLKNKKKLVLFGGIGKQWFYLFTVIVVIFTCILQNLSKIPSLFVLLTCRIHSNLPIYLFDWKIYTNNHRNDLLR